MKTGFMDINVRFIPGFIPGHGKASQVTCGAIHFLTAMRISGSLISPADTLHTNLSGVRCGK
jgi:hypothetical protein